MTKLIVSPLNCGNILAVFYGINSMWGGDSYTATEWEFDTKESFHVVVVDAGWYNMETVNGDHVGFAIYEGDASYNPQGSDEVDFRYLMYEWNNKQPIYIKNYHNKPLYCGYKKASTNYKLQQWIMNATIDIEYILTVRGYIYKEFPIGI